MTVAFGFISDPWSVGLIMKNEILNKLHSLNLKIVIVNCGTDCFICSQQSLNPWSIHEPRAVRNIASFLSIIIIDPILFLLDESIQRKIPPPCHQFARQFFLQKSIFRIYARIKMSPITAVYKWTNKELVTRQTDVTVRKTKRGNIVRIVRERYLRDDVGCGSRACEKCAYQSAQLTIGDSGSNFLDLEPASLTVGAGESQRTYLLIDIQMALHQVSEIS